MSKNKFYTLLIGACVAGYAWLAFTLQTNASHAHQEMRVCLFKGITGIPCPSCGSTRSAIAVLNGNFTEALMLNPIGFFLLSILLLSPVWILFDLVQKKITLLTFYEKTEQFLKRKTVAIPIITLVMLNWIWNIYKGL